MTEATLTPSDSSADVDESGASSLTDELRRLRERIDGLLVDLPENRVKARRMIAHELEIDPGAEQLQTIVRLAHDAAGQGPLRSLSRSALAVTVLVERELTVLLEPSELEIRALGRAAVMLSGARKIMGSFQSEIRGRMSRLADHERDYLLGVGDALLPGGERLTAAAVLAPRLLLVAQAADPAALRESLPSLSDEEVRRLADFRWPDGRGTAAPPRWFVNATVMRAILEDHLLSWERAQVRGEHDPASDRIREAVMRRLEQDRIAYQALAVWIRERHDAALAEGRQAEAEELSAAKRSLFSRYLKLAELLQIPEDEVEDSDRGEADLDGLLEQCLSGDAMAEARRVARVSKEELFLDALQDTGPPPAARAHRGRRRANRERLRLPVLAAAAVVLSVVCVALYAGRTDHGKGDLRVPLSSISGGVVLTRATGIGKLMYAEIGRYRWDEMTEAQRVARVKQIGESAVQSGFESVYITDENQQDLATWTKNTGARLAKTKP